MHKYGPISGREGRIRFMVGAVLKYQANQSMLSHLLNEVNPEYVPYYIPDRFNGSKHNGLMS